VNVFDALLVDSFGDGRSLRGDRSKTGNGKNNSNGNSRSLCDDKQKDWQQEQWRSNGYGYDYGIIRFVGMTDKGERLDR
jgi:hypothetical protein